MTDNDTQQIDKAVSHLIKALGLKEQQVSQIDVTATGRIRVFFIDRSLRSFKYTPLKRFARDAENRIIET